MLFETGQIVATPNAIRAFEEAADAIVLFALRHASGDWGELCEHDLRANDLALKDGTRFLSAYILRDGTKIWIITEADRSSTCVLLPEDY